MFKIAEAKGGDTTIGRTRHGIVPSLLTARPSAVDEVVHHQSLWGRRGKIGPGRFLSNGVHDYVAALGAFGTTKHLEDRHG